MRQRIGEECLAAAEHAKARKLIEHRLGIGEVAARILDADDGLGIARDEPRDERAGDRHARQMRDVIEADLESAVADAARSLRE